MEVDAVKFPGSDEWLSESDAGGKVPFASAVGTLVRYRCGIVMEVVGLTEPDSAGNRSMRMEIHKAR